MLSPSAQKVQAILQEMGYSYLVTELDQTTRSAYEASQAVGCEIGQIAKSLVFRGKRSGKPYLVIVSGANRVDEKRFGELVGEPIERPDANFVRQRTGFTIGGVPPVGHSEKLETYIDEDLMGYSEIWAAAGNPNAVFNLTPSDLPNITSGRVIRVNAQ